MGIFDFLKRIIKTDDVNATEGIAVEKLAFSEIESWVEKKIRENESEEKKVLFLVEEKILDFINELKGKIVILQSFDVGAKKEKDQIKNIVTDSREKYIESVENLIEKLNNLEEHKLEKFIEKINKIFFDFNKSSFKNYERATILIGKEMSNIKESLKVFSKDLLKVFERSKSIVDSFKSLLIIKEKLEAVNSIDKTLKRISEKKSNLKEEISVVKGKERILKQKLELIKTSGSYLENLAQQKKIESLRAELKNDILELKQLLDFKALVSFFHINPEQMKTVKEHRENFQVNFEKDKGKAIIELLDEAKLNNEEILEKAEQIIVRMGETANYERDLKDETQEVYSKIKEVGLKIDNIKIENVKEEKREEKLRLNRDELVGLLEEELEEMGVVVGESGKS